jgi:hypothetical protein
MEPIMAPMPPGAGASQHYGLTELVSAQAQVEERLLVGPKDRPVDPGGHHPGVEQADRQRDQQQRDQHQQDTGDLLDRGLGALAELGQLHEAATEQQRRERHKREDYPEADQGPDDHEHRSLADEPEPGEGGVCRRERFHGAVPRTRHDPAAPKGR